MTFVIENIFEKSLLSAQIFLFLFTFTGGISFLATNAGVATGVGLLIAVILTTFWSIFTHFVPLVEFKTSTCQHPTQHPTPQEPSQDPYPV